eukprot:TRINITY_DN1675_c0_g3_i1.p1 TRINITY_DN1675_c0_g3~~TRINITY_DN1675_c0_g3_i1.p1  ORF type:complete len:305 (+),score=28.87 TRINITY_DN1675_c0_g3_i1:239-1153(+)
MENNPNYESYQQAFWRFGEQLRLQANAGMGEGSNKWSFTPSNAALGSIISPNISGFSNLSLSDGHNSKVPSKAELRRNVYSDHGKSRSKSKHKGDKSQSNNQQNLDWKHTSDPKTNVNTGGKPNYSATQSSEKNNNNNNNNNNGGNNNNSSLDKRFKTLPPSESLPRNEALGGYIFVCNNDTMQDDLKRQLFGLPQRYRDSVRAITPGLPLFLYNYTTHQLHGIFEASSFGGTNIDPTAWEDKKCRGESRFPAQVRIRTRKVCKPLEEDAFRPILHHYDGPKFRLQLSIPETLALLDIFNETGL